MNIRDIQDALLHRAINLAANDRDGNVKPVNVPWGESIELRKLEKSGRLTNDGGFYERTWSLDGKPIAVIERRFSQRKIRLTYPELKPKMKRLTA